MKVLFPEPVNPKTAIARSSGLPAISMRPNLNKWQALLLTRIAEGHPSPTVIRYGADAVRDRLDAVKTAKRSKGCAVVPDVGSVKDIFSLADRHSRLVLRTYYPVRRGSSGSWLAPFAKSHVGKYAPPPRACHF